MNRNLDASILSEDVEPSSAQFVHDFQSPYSLPSQLSQSSLSLNVEFSFSSNSLTEQPPLLSTYPPRTLPYQEDTGFPSPDYDHSSHQPSPFPSSQPLTSPSPFIQSSDSFLPTPTSHSDSEGLGDCQSWGWHGYPNKDPPTLPLNPSTAINPAFGPIQGGDSQTGAFGGSVWEPQVPSGSRTHGFVTQNGYSAVPTPSQSSSQPSTSSGLPQRPRLYELPPQPNPKMEKRRIAALREHVKRVGKKKELQDLQSLLDTATQEVNQYRADIMRTKQNIEWYDQQVKQTEMSLLRYLDEDTTQHNTDPKTHPSTMQ